MGDTHGTIRQIQTGKKQLDLGITTEFDPYPDYII